MSLGEMQQLMELVREIDQMLGSIEAKTRTIETELPKTQEALFTTSQAIRTIWRLSSLMAHMGFPPDIQKAVRTLTQITHTAMMAYTAMKLVGTATPYGWIMGAISLGITSISIGSMLEGY